MAAIITLRATLPQRLAKKCCFAVSIRMVAAAVSAAAAIPVSAAAHAAIHGFPAILPLAFVGGSACGGCGALGSIVDDRRSRAHNVALMGGHTTPPGDGAAAGMEAHELLDWTKRWR